MPAVCHSHIGEFRPQIIDFIPLNLWKVGWMVFSMGLRVEQGESAGEKASEPANLFSEAFACDIKQAGASGGGKLEAYRSANAGSSLELPSIELSGGKHELPVPKPLETPKAGDEGLDHKPMYRLPHYRLSDEEKQRIDNYLRANKMNQYGDPSGTIYPEGNPLIDERTGALMNRYDFVLARVKIPGLDRDKLPKAV